MRVIWENTSSAWRRGGRIEAGSIYAPVGQEIEVFFRLHGRTDARVQVEVFHPGAIEVESCRVARRFEVAADGSKPEAVAAEVAPEARAPQTGPVAPEAGALVEVGSAWLEELPTGGVRELTGSEFYVKQTANDPDSIDVEHCTVPSLTVDTRHCWVTTCAVRGRNGFGAMILNRMQFEVAGGRIISGRNVR